MPEDLTLADIFKQFVGVWDGTNRLWLSPQDLVRLSESKASITLAAGARFMLIQYTWADGSKPQDGLLVVGGGESGRRVTAYWIDSWHMGSQVMLCAGEFNREGVSFTGSYPAPPGPDWGWRIELKMEPAGSLIMKMFNISPKGEDVLAVQVNYTRQS